MSRSFPPKLQEQFDAASCDLSRCFEALIVRPPLVGQTGEIGIGYSTLGTKVQEMKLFSAKSLGDDWWRGRSPDLAIKDRSDIVFGEDGDPEWSVTRLMDFDYGKLSGCDAMQLLIDPTMPSDRNQGGVVDAVWATTVIGIHGQKQDMLSLGGSRANETWTFSVYVCPMQKMTGSYQVRLYIALTNGTLLSEATSTLASVPSGTNGWYRVSYTKTFSAAPAYTGIRVLIAAPLNISSPVLAVTGAQMELGAAATAYERTSLNAAGTKNVLLNSDYPARNPWASYGANCRTQLNITGRRSPMPLHSGRPGEMWPSMPYPGVACEDGLVRFTPYDTFGQVADMMATTAAPTTGFVYTYVSASPQYKTYVFSAWVRTRDGYAAPPTCRLEMAARLWPTVLQSQYVEFRPSRFWKRVWVPMYVTAAGCDSVSVGFAIYNPAVNQYIEVCGAQLEEIAGDANRQPAFYQKTTGTPGSTNILPNSEDFTTWYVQNAAVTANTGYGPYEEFDVYWEARGNAPSRVRANLPPHSATTSAWNWPESGLETYDGFYCALRSVGSDEFSATDKLAGIGHFESWALGAPAGWTVGSELGTVEQVTVGPLTLPNLDTGTVGSACLLRCNGDPVSTPSLKATVTLARGWHTLFAMTSAVGAPPYAGWEIKDLTTGQYIRADGVTQQAGAGLTRFMTGTAGGIWGTYGHLTAQALHFYAKSAGQHEIRIAGIRASGTTSEYVVFDSVALYEGGGMVYSSPDRNADTDSGAALCNFTFQNLTVLARGVIDDEKEASPLTITMTMIGYLKALQMRVPNRMCHPECQWKFWGADCGYDRSATITANSVSPYTTHTCDSNADLEVGRTVVRNKQGLPIKILSRISTTQFTTDAAAQFLIGEGVTYTDCGRTMRDCEWRQRGFRYGGFRGLVGTLEAGNMQPDLEALGLSRISFNIGSISLFLRDNLVKYLGCIDPSMQGQFGRRSIFDSMAVPILYGRRVIALRPVEKHTMPIAVGSSTIDWTVGVYLIGEGEIDGIAQVRAKDGTRDVTFPRIFSDDEALVLLQNDTIRDFTATKAPKYPWMYQRKGGLGLNTVFSVGVAPATGDWQSDPWTFTLSQEIDERSNTGTAYSRSAYLLVMLASPDGEASTDVDIPEIVADVRGRLVQIYTAEGLPSGSPVFSRNPAWCLLDLLMDRRYGLGLPLAMFKMSDWVSAAAVYDGVLDSQEFYTVATQDVTDGTVIPVANISGAHIDGDVLLAGTYTRRIDAVDLLGQTIIVDSPVTISAGAAVRGKFKRFTCDLYIKEQMSIRDAIGAILTSCRSMLVWDGARLVLKPLYALTNVGTPSLSMIESSTVAVISDLRLGNRKSWRTTPNTFEAEYPSGGSLSSQMVAAKFIDADCGGLDFPRPVRITLPACSNHDQAQRAGLALFAAIAPTPYAFYGTANANQAVGFEVETGPYGLRAMIGERAIATVTVYLLGQTQYNGRIRGIRISPRYRVKFTAVPERDSMRLDVGSAYTSTFPDFPRTASESGGENSEPGHRRPKITLTIALVRATATEITVSIAYSGYDGGPLATGPDVGELPKSIAICIAKATEDTSAENFGTMRKRAPAYRVVFPFGIAQATIPLRDDWIETALKVWATTRRPFDAGRSNVLDVTAYRTTDEDSDPTIQMRGSGDNLVYDGQMDNPSGEEWTEDPTTAPTETPVDPTVVTNPDTTLPSVNSTAWNKTGGLTDIVTLTDGSDSTYFSPATTSSYTRNGISASNFGSGAAIGRVHARVREGGIGTSVRLYYKADGGAWTQFGIVGGSSSPVIVDVYGPVIAIADLTTLAVGAAGSGTTGTQARLIEIELLSRTGRWVEIGTRYFTLASDGVTAASISRRFPNLTPPDDGVVFAVATDNTFRLAVRRTPGANAPTDDVVVRLYDSLSATSWTALTIPDGEITSSWKTWIAKFVPSTVVQGTLWIFVETLSTNAVDVTQAGAAYGMHIAPYRCNPLDMSSGRFPDKNYGEARSFAKGSWLANTPRSSSHT